VKEKGAATVTEKGGKLLLFAALPVLLAVFVFCPVRAVQFFSLFLIFLVMGSKAYSEYLIRHLGLVRQDREIRAFRYEWIAVELWAINTGRLPAFLLVLEDSSGGIAVFRAIRNLCTLGRESRQLFRWEAYGSSRGVFVLGPATLRGCDPLGFFPFTLNAGETSRLFVYPASAYASIRSPGWIPLGNLSTADLFCEDLTRPRSLRDYQSGDESRRINWKASAKSPGLIVNEYELSLSFPLVIFLNADIREYPLKRREPYVERAIEAAAALCLMAARERQTLGLILHTASPTATPTATEYPAITDAHDSPLTNSTGQNAAVISPASFTLIPVLERLAALEPFVADSEYSSYHENSSGTLTAGHNSSPNAGPAEPGLAKSDIAEKAFPPLRESTERLLDLGKILPFGTRLIYIGPSLEEENYNALESLKRRRLSLEYLVIDEKNLGFLRFSHRYQIKETGYDLL